MSVDTNTTALPSPNRPCEAAALPDARFLIRHSKRVPFVDQNGLCSLEEAIRQLCGKFASRPGRA